MFTRNVVMKPFPGNQVPCCHDARHPTVCCPEFEPDAWDDLELNFDNKLFVRATASSVMHVPINLGMFFRTKFAILEDAGAVDFSQRIVLSRDVPPWSSEHLFAVTKKVPGHAMVRMSGQFHTRVFEGSFRDAPDWYEELAGLINGDRRNPADIFFYFASCPSCAAHYGKNYVVGIVRTPDQAIQAANDPFCG